MPFDAKYIDGARVLLEQQARERRQFTNYGSIASQIGVAARGMGGLLGQLCRETYETHGVLLGVLVGSKRSKFPSDGFFTLARNMDLMKSDDLPQDFYEAELKRVFAAYPPQRTAKVGGE